MRRLTEGSPKGARWLSEVLLALVATAVVCMAATTSAAANLSPSSSPDDAKIVVKSWTFADSTGGWGQPNGLTRPAIVDGCLVMKVTGFDPFFHSPAVSLDGRVAKHMRIKMRNAVGGQLKLYWRTSAGPVWAEAQSLSIAVKGDGQMHEYDIAIDHPKWASTVTQFRFDLEPADCGPGEWAIDEVTISRLGPKLDVQLQAQKGAVVVAGEALAYTARVQNTGGEALTGIRAAVRLPANVRLVGGALSRSVAQLAPGASLEWKVDLSATEIGYGQATLSAESNEASAQRGAVIGVTRRPSAPDGATMKAGFHSLPSGDVFAANGKVGLLFVRLESGVSHISIFRQVRENWEPMGTTSPISRLAFGLPTGDATSIVEASLSPTSVEQTATGAVLSGSFTDAAQGVWRYSFDFSLAGDQVAAAYELSCSMDRDLYLWSGPSVQAGEGSFGATKKDALFPGLEWLVGNEQSSSTLDLAPPANLRWAPNPLKVTIPLMAVSDGQSLVGLLWDAGQTWDGVRAMPTARFASPNWVEGQPNQLMSLTVPSIPEYVAENGDLATRPYPLRAGQKLALSARIVARAGASALDAVSDWVATYGLAKPQAVPMSYDAMLQLGRFGYTNTVWVDGEGFRHCAGWAPGPAPAHALLLYLDLMALEKDNEPGTETVRNELKSRIDWTAERVGPGGLASAAASHLAGWEFPFYYGHLGEALQTVREGVYATADSQQEDGSWTFQPSTPEQATLGEAGSTESGLILTPTVQLMRWARITGDQAILESGLKALKRAMDFRVPRAAQVWECPVHSPDILSAARGVQAYLDAYIITGEGEYLDEARYWAKAGLPFLYMWGQKDLPLMKYSSIPIYGATFFSLSWLGRPVQWNGLVYAYWLFQLAEYDKSFEWAQVAEGVTHSGMHQMMTEGPYKGTYPDSWLLDGGGPSGPYINPEDVLKNVWVLKGQNPELSTIVFRGMTTSSWTGKRLHMTSAAKLSAELRTKDGFEVTMSFRAGWPTYSVVAGGQLPKSVAVGGKVLRQLARGESLEGTPSGWTYDTSNGRLYVKLTHTGVDKLRVIYGK